MNNKLLVSLAIACVAVLLAAVWYVGRDNDQRASEQFEGDGAQSTSETKGDSAANFPANSADSDSLQAGSANANGAASPGSSANDPLPEVPEQQTPPAEVTLWEVDADSADVEFENIPAKRAQTPPEFIPQLHVGQTLHLPLPHTQTVVTTELSSTHNQSAKVNVWRGDLLGGEPGENVIITRGAIETHVVVATEGGTYNAIIDNATGRTVVIDHGDVTAGQVPEDDAIYVEPVEQEPPPR